MFSRRRAIGLFALAILAVVGYRAWDARHARVTISETSVTRAKPTDHSFPARPTVEEATKSEPVVDEKKGVPSDAAKRLGALPLPEELRRPGANTVAEALAQWEQMDESGRAAYFQALVLFCLQNDRAATADLLAALGDEKSRDFGLSFALLHWAETDPVAALRWATDHPRGENDHARYHAAYEGFAGQRPLEALQALERADMAGDRDELSRIVIFHYTEQDRLPEARDWIEQLPEGNLRELLVQQTVHFWAMKAPAEAANWLASTASDETFRKGMGTLVHTIVEDDPRTAAGLTQRFAEPQIRQDYLADVIYVWAKRDLGAAAAWLHEQPPGPDLDAATARLVEAIAPNDPGEARQWANTISDPKKREHALRGLRPQR